MGTLSIQQVSTRLGVSAHTLRYYERARLIPPVGRARNGQRRYSDTDLLWIVFVIRLRATGMPISKIRSYTELALKDESTVAQRLALLIAHRDEVRNEIALLGKNLKVIEDKIAHYQGIRFDGTTPPDCVSVVPGQGDAR